VPALVLERALQHRSGISRFRREALETEPTMEVAMYDRHGPWGRSDRSIYGWDRGFDRSPGYGWNEPRPRRGFEGRRPARYGGDYWWMGSRGIPSRGFAGPYDEAYRRFSEQTHPRYTPIDGMQPGMGARGRDRINDRENQWFSDWTRWF
jgi:hypothetical protein